MEPTVSRLEPLNRPIIIISGWSYITRKQLNCDNLTTDDFTLSFNDSIVGNNSKKIFSKNIFLLN